MRSEQIDLSRYDSDKIETDYLKTYDSILEPLVSKEIFMLEMGVNKGGSLQMWRDYFPKGEIVGVDFKLPENFSGGERIQTFEGSQEDTKFLTEVANKTAPNGYDIIIDDAAHIGLLAKKSFWHLFENHLKPGGLYVIEDWGTGYWEDWPDGKRANLKNNKFLETSKKILLRLFVPAKYRLKQPIRSHNHGMVGFIKELVDEVGVGDLLRGGTAVVKTRQPKLRNCQMLWMSIPSNCV